MKKVFVFFSFFILMSFTPKNDSSFRVTDDTWSVNCKIITLDGMRFAVFSRSTEGNSPFVVNLTKDKLECEYYKCHK